MPIKQNCNKMYLQKNNLMKNQFFTKENHVRNKTPLYYYKHNGLTFNFLDNFALPESANWMFKCM